MCLCVACCRYVDIQQQEAGAGPASAGASGYGAAKQKRPSRRDPYALGKKANVQGFIRRMAITAEQLGVNLDDFPQHGASPLVGLTVGWLPLPLAALPGCGPCDRPSCTPRPAVFVELRPSRNARVRVMIRRSAG
jgi:hypothetical protein